MQNKSQFSLGKFFLGSHKKIKLEKKIEDYQNILKEKNLSEVKLVNKTKIEDELQKGKVSILMLTQVDYRTGELYDLKKINNIAKKMGVITVWDFAHSIGALPLNVREDDVDFAVGCTYKYLCGGPGSPAFIYVNPKYIDKINPIIAGWLGHENAYEKMQALIDFGVIGDYREPNIMRFGFNPLYNSEEDIIKAVEILNKILKNNLWKNKKYSKRKLVT